MGFVIYKEEKLDLEVKLLFFSKILRLWVLVFK